MYSLTMNNTAEPEAIYDMDGNCVCKLEGCAFCYPDLAEDEDYEDDYEPSTVYDMSDDAEALASAGWGTDEQYGYYGGEDDF